MGKIGARCQVCDGPIANGRCKLCGMTYRNDEILYHLNENKEEHYRHASAKAKKIMRENQVPLGDKTPAPAGKGKAAKGMHAEKSAADMWIQQNTKKTAAANPGGNGSSKVYAGTGKKNKKSRLVWIILVLVMVFGSAGAEIIEFVQDTLFHVVESNSVETTSTEIEINNILK